MNRKQKEDPSASKEAMLVRLSKWDDDIEAERMVEEYYRDRQLWARKRVEYRRKEKEKDDRDREAEERESGTDKSRAAALADSFLEQQAFEINVKAAGAPQPLRLRMTRENVKTAQINPAKRSMDQVEGLLEEEDEGETYKPTTKKRTLIPIEYDGEEKVNERASQAERLRKVVASIPS